MTYKNGDRLRADKPADPEAIDLLFAILRHIDKIPVPMETSVLLDQKYTLYNTSLYSLYLKTGKIL